MAAGAQDLDLAPRREDEHGAGIFRRGETRLHLVLGHDREIAPIASFFKSGDGEDRAGPDRAEQDEGENPNHCPASSEIKSGKNESRAPECSRREPGVLRRGEEGEMLFRPAFCQLEGARLIAHETEIGLRFGLGGLEREGAFVVENGVSEILGPEIGVPEIVEDARAPVAPFDERLVALDRFRKIFRGISGIGLGESRLRGALRLGSRTRSLGKTRPHRRK